MRAPRVDRDGLTLRGAIARLDLAMGRHVPLLDDATLERISRALERSEASGARSMIVTGGREGTFAAGADLNELARLDAMTALGFSRRGQTLCDRIETASMVVIAAVDGRCIGGAFDLVMSCDLRLATEEASFSHPGPTMGFITGYGGTSRLPRLATGGVAAQLLAGRLTLGAGLAMQLGLVSDLVPAGRLDDRARDLAASISAAPVGRARLIKQTLRALRGSVSPRRLERRLVELQLLGGESR